MAPGSKVRVLAVVRRAHDSGFAPNADELEVVAPEYHQMTDRTERVKAARGERKPSARKCTTASSIRVSTLTTAWSASNVIAAEPSDRDQCATARGAAELSFAMPRQRIEGDAPHTRLQTVEVGPPRGRQLNHTLCHTGHGAFE